MNETVTEKEPDTISKPDRINKIESLWQNYWTGRDNNDGQTYRNQLLEYYYPIARYNAKKIYRKLPLGAIELDDLRSMGIFGLKDAIEAFDPERNIKFESYASPRIRGAMLDELRKMDWVPRLIRQRANQVENAKQDFKNNKGYSPSDKELVNYLAGRILTHPDKSESFAGRIDKKTSLEKRRFYAKMILNDSKPLKLIPLEGSPNEENESEKIYQLKDYIGNRKSPNPLTEVQKKDFKEYLTKGLSKTEKLVVILYYYGGMEMKEIGKTIDISESRVSQMHSSIISRLKTKLTNKSTNHTGKLELII